MAKTKRLYDAHILKNDQAVLTLRHQQKHSPHIL